MSKSRKVNDRVATQKAGDKGNRDPLLRQKSQGGKDINNMTGQKHSEKELRLMAQADEMLRKSEELYRSLFENMLNGFAYCRMLFSQNQPQDFIYLNVNKSFESLTGLKNVIGKKVTEVIPGIRESDPELLKIYGRVALTGTPETFEAYVKALGIWFLVSVYSPEKEHFVAIFDVITKRKQTELELKESEQKYKALTENSITGVFISQDNKYLYANNRFAQMHGYTVEEILALTSDQLTHPDDRKAMRERIARRLKGEDLSESVVRRRLKKDGQTLWVELIGSIIDYKGKPALTGNLVDITERIKAEQSLKESEEKYRGLTENSLIGVFILQDERYVYVNNRFARIHGYKAKEIQDLHYLKLIHPDDRESVKERTARRLKGELLTKPIMRRRLKKDGQTIWTEALGTTIEYGGKPAVMGNLVDITERKKTEEELNLKSQLLDNASDLIFLHEYNQDLKLIYANEIMASSLGYSREELMNMNLRQLVAPEFAGLIPQRQQELANKNTITFESAYRRKDGSSIPVEIKCRLVEFDNKKLGLVSARDITERKKTDEYIKQLAYYEPLTGLPNRTLFNDRFNLAVAHAKRYQHMLAVMMLDLDKFKDINDTLGHDAGDKLLREIGNKLTGTIRATDTVSRMGGDEFAVLLAETNNEEDATSVARKVLEAIRKPYVLYGHKLTVTTSIGIAIYPDDGSDLEDLLKHADLAMYRIKQEGRNGYLRYTPEMDTKL